MAGAPRERRSGFVLRRRAFPSADRPTSRAVVLERASATILAMRLYRELRELEEKGIDLIEIAGQDRHLRSPEDLKWIAEALSRAGEDLHAELLYFLTHRRFPAPEARAHWIAIQKHKRHLAERLGRPVKFRVATLDYFTFKQKELRGVRLLAREEYDGLLDHLRLDEVTGVYTRRYFAERLPLEIGRARRYASELSLLIVDLDHFKRINDELGHVHGDAILRRVGSALRETTRQSDAVCRYGGDEFALILPETSNSEAYTLAIRVRDAVTRAIEQAVGSTEWALREGGVERLGIGVSLGGATFPVDCDDGDALVGLADQLCLDAKRRGKRRVSMSGEGQTRSGEGTAMRAKPGAGGEPAPVEPGPV